MFNVKNALRCARIRKDKDSIEILNVYREFINEYPEFRNNAFGFFLVCSYGHHGNCDYFVNQSHEAERVNDMGFHKHACNATYRDAKNDILLFNNKENIFIRNIYLQFCTESHATNFILTCGESDTDSDKFAIAEKYGELIGVTY